MYCRHAVWNVDGDRDLSEAWTGFTQFTILNEKPPDGYYMVRGAADKEANIIKTTSFVARNLVKDVKSSSTKRKARRKKRQSKNRSSTMQED